MCQRPELPLVTILCTNYNNADFIPDMVKSLTNQTYHNWELIFVDDGSPDNSLDTINSFKTDSRIQTFSSPKNLGAGAAAKMAVKHGKGTIMGRLDSDDALTPNAIAVMVNAHLQHPDASLITSQVIPCNAELIPMAVAWHQNKPLPQGKTILEHPTVGHFATFKTENYNLTKGFEDSLQRAVDLDIYIKLEETGNVVTLNNQLYLYRKNANGISQGGNGTLAKALAYQVMVDGYFRRKASGFKPNLTRSAARDMLLRKHQIDIARPLPLIAPWYSLWTAVKTFPELLIHPTIWRNTLSATIRNL